MAQLPQMPSRQSWSNATGSSSCRISFSLSVSIISRNDMSGLTPSRAYVVIAPASVRVFCRQMWSVRFIVLTLFVTPLRQLHVLEHQRLDVADRLLVRAGVP